MTIVAMQGKFVWYDLMTSDTVGAVEFYGSLVGWGIEEWEGDTPYPMWQANTGTIGGLMSLPEMAKKAGAPPHWLGYVAVQDVDETVKQAEQAGAQIYVPGQEIPNIGRFAIFADPQGAVIAAYSSDQPHPDMAEPQVGNVSWHELMTSDLEAASDFYTSIFGWSKVEDVDMGEYGIYRMFGVGDGPPMVGVFQNPSEEQQSEWVYYVNVDDVDVDAKRLEELGGKVVNGPMEVPGGDRIVQGTDPQGAAFALHSVKK